MYRRLDAGWVTLEVNPPISALQEELRALGRDLDNFRPALRAAVREVVIPSIRTNFSAGGRPQWEPLASSTIERRLRQGTGTQILVESGRLQRAATQFARWDIGRDQAKITNWPSNVRVRAAVHQGGATVNFAGGERRTRHLGPRRGVVRPRVRAEVKAYTVVIPPRPFLLLQDEDVRQIERVFVRWLEDKIARRRR
jgi:phage gpG-like protein